jgi:glycosyltransferase involved in cell wall biosynthesis
MRMGKPTLLITSFHPSGSGNIGAGEAISKDLVEDLLGTGGELVVLCFAPPNQSADPTLVSRCLAYHQHPHGIFNALSGIATAPWPRGLFSPWFFTRVSRRNVSEVKRVKDRYDIGDIWLNFPSSLGFSSHLQGESLSYLLHDVVGQRIGRRFFLRLLLPMVRRTEAELLLNISSCRVLSDKDSRLLAELGYAGTTAVQPPRNIAAGQVAGGVSVTEVLKDFHGHKNLVFFGNMGRSENHTSIMHFLLFAFPRIYKQHKDVQLWILGLSPHWTLRLAARLCGGVRVVGAVDDPAPAFRAADICIAPIRQGAGVKIKVLQMLEAGAKVIASAVAAEGIPSHENLQVLAYEDIPNAVNSFLDRIEARST